MTPSDTKARRDELYGLLGDLPPRDYSISAETVALEQRDGYWLETLSLDLNGIERVPAYFAKPSADALNLPTVLYHHAHGGNFELGKDEFIHGRPAIQNPPYAKLLTEMGMCGLCIDCWNFGERRGRTESELFKEMLWKGQVLWGMMMYDALRSVDYLLTRPEVDGQRIGTLGLSLGSTEAWWLAALDERIKVCVDMCCLTDYDALIATRGLDGHGIYYYVPSLLKHFSTSQINNLIAPRPHLATAGNYDKLTPPAGLDKIDAAARQAYAAAGAADAWQMLRYDTGHFENSHARHAIVQWLQKWL